MSRTKQDVADDKSDRFIGCALIPLWLPIKVVGIIVGVLFELVRMGFSEGRGIIQLLSSAWRGPDKEE